MPNQKEPDQEIREALRWLPRLAPRPGYEQRFWARADAAAPARAARWRWLPVAALGLGLALGIALADLLPRAPNAGLTVVSPADGWPEGSLTATFTFTEAGD